MFGIQRIPSLSAYAQTFLALTDKSRLSDDTRRYYRNGVRLLGSSCLAGKPIDRITRQDISCLSFGSAANTNNALRTLSRMLTFAQEDRLIQQKPKIHMAKENRRQSMLTAEWEALILPVAKPLLQDVIVLMRDMGARNRRELYRVRVEHIQWERYVISVCGSKTPAGTREVPFSERAAKILRRHAAGRKTGWLFPSRRSASGHLTTVQKQWKEALDTLREKGIAVPDDLVLYCARHDFGTSAYRATKNLFAVMKAMGHADVKSAMQYQHQDISEVAEYVRLRA